MSAHDDGLLLGRRLGAVYLGISIILFMGEQLYHQNFVLRHVWDF
jgi:hypothetical protein